jgi:hypothetical protein
VRHAAAVPPNRDDLQRIARLRDLFLDDARGPQALADYWRSDADLAAYDAVLAPRIGWKWDAALAECLRRGWPRHHGSVLDYGCGSGIAARRYLAHCRADRVWLHDRSPRAMAFAARRLAEVAPGTAVHPAAAVADLQPDVLLVSHVLGELDARGEAELRVLLARCTAVLVVEPGSKQVARRLSALRDDLRAAFQIVAPCTHAAACPALQTADDWCHLFAAPPPEVFTDGEIVRTAKAVGIDLRALPYAFVAAVRQRTGLDPDAGCLRQLGRPEVTPHAARVSVCGPDGRQDRVVHKRDEPALWRQLKKAPDTLPTLPAAGRGPTAT